MRRFAIAIIAATLVFGLVGGVVRAASSPSASPGGDKVVLRIGMMQEVDNLNPFVGYSVPAYEVYHLNYDMLVGYAPNGDVRPEIADSWTASPDGLVWTFKIHPGIKWQDGTPLTAKDVAFTYNYIIDNELSAFSSYTVNMKAPRRSSSPWSRRSRSSSSSRCSCVAAAAAPSRSRPRWPGQT